METSTVVIITCSVIAVAIVLAVAVVACCLCCYCCKNRSTRAAGKTTANHHHRHNKVSPGINLESGLFQPTQKPTVESDGPGNNSVTKERPPVARLPNHFRDFVVQKVIPYFNDQRASAYQFAVVILLSKNDFENISRTRFTPNLRGKPILDKTVSVMPQDHTKYGNYIVARPSSNSCHSEEEIFGHQCSVTDSPFSHLWNTYVERNHGAYPKCIFIYSWNLPCSRCTDVIIRSLREEPYNRVSVIVAHTRFWDRSESESQLKKNTQKLACENIMVKQVPYPVHLPPA